MDNEGLTQYTRIAISLAERIASGQLKEGEKLSGRSKLSPEYNVSPETIRRTLRLLADMKVVEVKEQSGSMSCPPTMPAAISTTSRIRPTYGENSSSSRNCWSVRNI